MVVGIPSRSVYKRGQMSYERASWICKSGSSLRGFHVVFIVMFPRRFASGGSPEKRISVGRRFPGKSVSLEGLLCP
jgi:hypothetical protein